MPQLQFDFEHTDRQQSASTPLASEALAAATVNGDTLSSRMGITMKRIREVRTDGLADPLSIRDWIEAITGTDPGPIPDGPPTAHRSAESAAADSSPAPNGATYTLDDWKEFMRLRNAAELTAEKWIESFGHLRRSKDPFVAALIASKNAAQVKHIAGNLGSFDARRQTKAENANSAYRCLIQTYLVGSSVRWNPLGNESFEDAVAKLVEQITDDDLAHFY